MTGVVFACQLVSVSEFHAATLRVPASVADDVTSLVGHVVAVFSPHLSALCGAYDTYLAGIDDASAIMRHLRETDPTFTHYIDVIVFLCTSVLYVQSFVHLYLPFT